MPEIVRASGGEIIGSIENGVFIKRVKTAHMLHTPRGWAIDCQAFLTEVFPKAHTIRIENTETGVVYEVSTKTFNLKKKYINRGFGAQYVLVMRYWKEVRKEQPALI